MERVPSLANHVTLSPISFLERASIVYGERPSIIYGDVRFAWRETLERCTKLASGLSQLGIDYGDVVATFLPNIPAMYELFFGVSMAGGVLCALNIHQDSTMLSVLLKQAEAKIIFVDHQFYDLVSKAIEIISQTTTICIPKVIVVLDIESAPIENGISHMVEYESILENGSSNFEVKGPKDELDPITLNFTSGTTSTPKGVVYNHRGAYLNSLVSLLLNEMQSMPVYLWTVPMFHCSGWCLAWGVAAQGGTNIFLRNFTPREIFSCIVEYKVTHMGGAPTVLNMIVNASDTDKKKLPGKVVVMTGGAPPPPHVLFKMEDMGFLVIHAYGMTETYGPGAICAWKPEWNSLPANTRAKLKARQGVQHMGMQGFDVKDPITMISVPADGKTIGEIMFRGNTVMSGYWKDAKATNDAFKGGWFHTGDLGVKHPDGYIEFKDRSQDTIVARGENISTIEIEAVLFSHPAVLEAAVVGKLDDFWGETPCAFVKLKDGNCIVTIEEIIKFCNYHLPHIKAPYTVIFGDLPKTSTGKTQKFVLRDKAKAMGSL